MALTTLETVDLSIEGVTETPPPGPTDLTRLMLVMMVMGMMSSIAGQMEL